jgi:hypothetical protein
MRHPGLNIARRNRNHPRIRMKHRLERLDGDRLLDLLQATGAIALSVQAKPQQMQGVGMPFVAGQDILKQAGRFGVVPALLKIQCRPQGFDDVSHGAAVYVDIYPAR